MEILHATNTYSELYGGGIHEVVYHLANAQRSAGHNPSVAFPTRCGDGNIPGGSASPIPISGPMSWFFSYGALSELNHSHTTSGFEVIHQHGVWTYMSMFSLLAQKKLGVPRLVQPHGLLDPHRLLSRKVAKVMALLSYEHLSLTQASALIACSPNEAEALKERFPRKHVAIIPNGVPDLFFNAPKANVATVSREKRCLLFLSQLIPVKGLERFFHAIHRVGPAFKEQWHVQIAGYGDTEYLASLQKVVKQLDLSDTIRFIGPIYGDEKIKKFDECSAFILPTYDENFGIVVAEALARKKPVITTKGAPWAILEESSAGIWADNTDRGVMNAINKLTNLTDAELIQMGKNGRKYVENHLRWDNVCRQYMELYQFVLKRRRKPDFVY